ncbi:MAG: hypothetical protein IPL78_11360 [Chloroflexi bacterium]|nr:hypothetical protein [Chloroflexota bacterium]
MLNRALVGQVWQRLGSGIGMTGETMKQNWGEYGWYAAAIGLSVAAVLLSQWLGLAVLVLLPALPVGAYLFWRRPEIGVYLILVLVCFGNEYSETEWGVRPAADLATIYNRRIIPGLTASVFDLIFVVVLVAWLGRKWPKRGTDDLARPSGALSHVALPGLRFLRHGSWFVPPA